MRHIPLAITSFAFLVSRSHQIGTYECTYTYEDGSKITRDELTEDNVNWCVATHGSDDCKCSRMATKCTFGPDDDGEFTID